MQESVERTTIRFRPIGTVDCSLVAKSVAFLSSLVYVAGIYQLGVQGSRSGYQASASYQEILAVLLSGTVSLVVYDAGMILY